MVAFTVMAAVKDQVIILAGVWTSTEKSPIMKCGYTVSLYPCLLYSARGLKCAFLESIENISPVCFKRTKSFWVRFYSSLKCIYLSFSWIEKMH